MTISEGKARWTKKLGGAGRGSLRGRSGRVTRSDKQRAARDGQARSLNQVNEPESIWVRCMPKQQQR